jgi:hypothetical protein
MFKRIAGTALILGALLAVAPAGAFARERDDRGRWIQERHERDRRVHIVYEHARFGRDCRR